MSWYSNIASRVNNSVSSLQRSVFNSETDGDTLDDTYVCRVLRQHYTEKGTGFPQWLPPDPKAPPPVVVQPAAAAPLNSRYGGGNLQTSQSVGGLSSLWDKNRAAGGGASAPPSMGSRNPFAQRGAAVSPDPAAMGGVQARPLPSQRTGSYQTTGSGAGAGAGAAGSIQDRLRSKLGSGARTVSPGSASGPFAPPPAQGGGGAGSGDYDPYRAGNYGGGGGQAGYGDAGAGGSGSRYGGGGLPSGPRRMGGLPSGPRMR